jgi:hypothetical protein
MNNDLNQELKNQEKDVAANMNNIMVGISMMLIGGIALLSISGIEILGRSPWMLMALLPVGWIIMAAYNKYLENGRKLNKHVAVILLFALIPFAYMLFPILGLSVNVLWPMSMIFIGLCFVLLRGK